MSKTTKFEVELLTAISLLERVQGANISEINKIELSGMIVDHFTKDTEEEDFPSFALGDIMQETDEDYPL